MVSSLKFSSSTFSSEYSGCNNASCETLRFAALFLPSHLAKTLLNATLPGLAAGASRSMSEFREDLKQMLLEAGCEDRPVVLFVRDSQITNDRFLEVCM